MKTLFTGRYHLLQAEAACQACIRTVIENHFIATFLMQLNSFRLLNAGFKNAVVKTCFFCSFFQRIKYILCNTFSSEFRLCIPALFSAVSGVYGLKAPQSMVRLSLNATTSCRMESDLLYCLKKHDPPYCGFLNKHPAF